MGSKCSKRGSREMYKNLKHYLKNKGMKDEVELIITECTDRCKFAPVLAARPQIYGLKNIPQKTYLNCLMRYQEINDIICCGNSGSIRV
jgi:NADH:ubiquinone oxidoreductase subunit E